MPRYLGGYDPLRFSYTPDQNDPELLLMRSRALRGANRGRSNLLNELDRSGINRASGVGLGAMMGYETDFQRTLEDITNQNFERQRRDSFQLYKDQLDFERQRQLMEEQYKKQRSLMGLGALGDIAGLAGEFLLPGIGGVFGRGLVNGFGGRVGALSGPVNFNEDYYSGNR